MVGTTTSAAANAAKQAASKMHRRSRTGCFTCRLRRKKCDEGKGACRACKHLGLKCEYKRPVWWSNNEQRRNQKEVIKNIIKRTKLNEKTAQGVTNTPPSLCHSMQTSDTYSDGIACTRAQSVDSQNSLEYNFNTVTPPDYYNVAMPPPMFAPVYQHPGQFAPYEIDIKTESQMFINDIPTRRDSSFSTFSHYQTPPAVNGFPTDNWIQQDYFESHREAFADEPLDFCSTFDFPTHGAFSPSHQPMVQVDESEQHLLTHFVDNVMRMVYPVLEANQPGSARNKVILPALESNRAYLHACLSVSALHMKTTQGLQGEEIDNDVYRNRFAAVQQLTDSLMGDRDHAETLEATLGMIFFPCSVGRFDDALVDIPWHQHFQAVQSLVHKLDLPSQLVALNGQQQAQPPFNMTLASWIDILGATMLGRTPSFADTYREKLIADAPSGLAELMGCEDRIMYLISEIACLDALKQEGMDDVQLCQHIQLLGEQISLTEPPVGSNNSALSSTGEILPKQLRRNMTAVYRLAARIYLCSLVPDFDRTQPINANLVSALSKAMDYIPAGSEGFDRSLVWPLLVAGTVSLPNSSFRKMFSERTARLGDASNSGSFGRMKALLNEVWSVNDYNLSKGIKQSVHWRDTMQQKGWDFLLI
ncbi:fungal-specific transcription factor domain-containing protein [Boeremia exigua]|uniref:fungal-specific transcription factor domain-containing protein n=1 Tax=Boeremia exigua TaxID=749465 RepID=UPI001E8CC413|nr:fungal-specific transcription factor domain-containing protein [Boeremia exigua]KAH6612453.1 fungal-specific transcription factor domain-containing protein [Boeremia exigua]